MPELNESASGVQQSVARELEPVRKSVLVRSNAADAFRVFTEGMDGWWPRSYHIGDSPMKQIVVEGRAGGRIYTNQEDGTICQWGTVLEWEPPTRFLMAWQVSPEWRFEPELAQCSQVEVRFTQVGERQTLVELEHSGLQKQRGAWEQMRAQIDSEGGWGSLLRLYAERAGTDV